MRSLLTPRSTGAATLLIAFFVFVPWHAAHAQNQVFHKGDKVLASPYANTWQVCTLTTDRLGSPRYYSYTALCEPVVKGSTANLQQRNFTEDNVKALNDPTASAQFAAQNGGAAPAPVAPNPPRQPGQAAPPAPVPPPPGQPAANPAQYKVGDRVAMPSGSGKWFDAVIISIDPNDPVFPYRVHPLGYLSTMDAQYSAKQLRPLGSVKTEPIGGIVDDPYLLAAQGKKAFQPSQLYPGVYECFTLTNGQLVSAAILNFSVVDRTHYQSVTGGATAEYRFDPATGAVTFLGGGLQGQRAKYVQASNPPVRSQPPEVRLERSGDYCQLKMY